jgi:hypothetical protein
VAIPSWDLYIYEIKRQTKINCPKKKINESNGSASDSPDKVEPTTATVVSTHPWSNAELAVCLKVSSSFPSRRPFFWLILPDLTDKSLVRDRRSCWRRIMSSLRQVLQPVGGSQRPEVTIAIWCSFARILLVILERINNPKSEIHTHIYSVSLSPRANKNYNSLTNLKIEICNWFSLALSMDI